MWFVPVCVYVCRGEADVWDFEGVVEVPVRSEWPAVLTLERRVVPLAPMDRVPFVILNDRRRSTAFSASGAEWDCTGCRLQRSSRFHMESNMIMLHFESPVVSYTMHVPSGRLALSGQCLVLSDVLCMPRRVHRADIAFLRKQRSRSIKKQMRDQRVVIDLGRGRAATYMPTTWMRVDSVRGGGGVSPE